MDRMPYTSAQWTVRPGQEEAFVAAWQEVGKAFLRLPRPPAWGILLRSEEDPRRFVSFGPWPDNEAIDAMRADAKAADALNRIRALCEEASPGAYHVAAVAGRLPDELSL
jgi:hypothetical protein